MSNNPFGADIFDVLTELDRYTDQHLEFRNSYNNEAYSYLLWRVCYESHDGGIASDSLIIHLYGMQYDVFFELADMITATSSFTESTHE